MQAKGESRRSRQRVCTGEAILSRCWRCQHFPRLALDSLALAVSKYTKKCFCPIQMHRAALTCVTQSVGRRPVLQNKRSQV